MVIGVDDDHSAAIFTQLSAAAKGKDSAQAHPVSVGKVLGRGLFVVDGVLYDATSGRANKVMEMADAPRLPGAHNWQNAALAYGAVRPFVSDIRQIIAAIASFPGLAHRMEDVGHIGKATFINDSKATNADATARALAVYPDIFWIAGGKPKEGGLEAIEPFLPRIRRVFLIGEAAEAFNAALSGKIDIRMSGTLAQAVQDAYASTRAERQADAVVLLSPACASFDQFANFEERGREFARLVRQLPVAGETAS